MRMPGRYSTSSRVRRLRVGELKLRFCSFSEKLKATHRTNAGNSPPHAMISGMASWVELVTHAFDISPVPLKLVINPIAPSGPRAPPDGQGAQSSARWPDREASAAWHQWARASCGSHVKQTPSGPRAQVGRGPYQVRPSALPQGLCYAPREYVYRALLLLYWFYY